MLKTKHSLKRNFVANKFIHTINYVCRKNGMITIRGSSLRPLQLNPLIEVINSQERSEKHL